MTLKARIYLATFFLLFTAVILGYVLSQLFRGVLPLDLASFVVTLLLGATVAILFNIVMRSAKRLRLVTQQSQSTFEPTATQLQTPITIPSTPVRTVTSERSVAPQPPSPTIQSPSPQPPPSPTIQSPSSQPPSPTIQPPSPQPPSPTIQSPSPQPPSSRKETPPEVETQEKLLKMLQGDRNTAERLIAESKERYPDFSENWYWGKVIADLERDRR